MKKIELFIRISQKYMRVDLNGSRHLIVDIPSIYKFELTRDRLRSYVHLFVTFQFSSLRFNFVRVLLPHFLRRVL